MRTSNAGDDEHWPQPERWLPLWVDDTAAHDAEATRDVYLPGRAECGRRYADWVASLERGLW